MPVLLVAALLASQAPPARLLVVSPEAELRRATVAALASETSVALSPALEGSAACGDVGCARQQALAVNAEFALVVRRTTDGASLRLLDTAEGFVVGAKDVVAADDTTLGAALGAEARALLRIARPPPAPAPDPPPVEAGDIAPLPPPADAPPAAEPPAPERPAERPKKEESGWGNAAMTIVAVLGLVVIGAATCLGVSAAADGCQATAADCGNACSGIVACGVLAGACVSDAPATCAQITDACDTGVAACNTGLACLRACNAAVTPDDDSVDPLIEPPEPRETLAMAY
jgi:hypothetical protein